MDDLISRKDLLEAYDKAHQGPPGGARKLIEEAPRVLERDEGYPADVNRKTCVEFTEAEFELIEKFANRFTSVQDAILIAIAETNMGRRSFGEAYRAMRMGKRVAHDDFKGGYWACENGTIMIHCYDGKVLDIRETDDVDYTFHFIEEDKWNILPD